MPSLRRARILVRLVLTWFVLSLGVAIASPVVHPQAMELLCTSSGAIKVVVHGEDGAQELGSTHMDCPLCVLTGAPPPPLAAPSFAQPLPLGRALQPIPAAHIAAATAAPLPARGPPALL